MGNQSDAIELNDAASDLYVKVMEAIQLARPIAFGQKAQITPTNHWFYRHIQRMFDNDGLAESPPDYFLHPTSEALNRSNVSLLPDTYSAWEAYRRVKSEFRSAGISKRDDCVILGIESHDSILRNRAPGSGPSTEFSEAGNLVFTNQAGLNAAYLLLEAIRYNIENSNKKKRIIIENASDLYAQKYWDEFLSGLGFLKNGVLDTTYLEKLGIYVVANEKEAREQLRLGGNKIGKIKSRLNYSDGVELFYVSTNGRKRSETTKLVEIGNRAAVVGDPADLFGYFESALEVQLTYSGNAWEKLREGPIKRTLTLGDLDAKKQGQLAATAQEQWHYGYHKLLQIAEQRPAGFTKDKRLNPKKIMFAANDTGGYVDITDEAGNSLKDDLHINLAIQQEFKAAFPYCIPEKPWPGVELNHIMDALGGPEKLFEFLKKFKERYKSETGKSIKFQWIDKVTIVAMTLAEKIEDVKFLTSHASVRSDICLDPRPATDKPKTTDSYIIPRIPENPNGLTIEEIGRDKILAQLPEELALTIFFRQIKLPKNSAHEIAERQAKNLLEYRPVKILTYTDLDNFINPNNPDGLSRLTSFLAEFDGYTFPPDATRSSPKDFAFARLGLGFTATLEAEQIRIRGIYGKPRVAIGLVDESLPDHPIHEDHPCADIWKLVRKGQRAFLVKDRADLLLTYEPSMQGAERRIFEASRANEYRSAYPFERESWGKDVLPKAFRVTVLGSASSKKPEELEEAYHLVDQICQETQWGPVQFNTGGGRYGIMRAVHEQIDQVRQTINALVYRKEIHCPQTVHMEQSFLNDMIAKGWDDRDQFVIAADIDKRCDEIGDTDCIVACGGGVGTLREIFRFICDKEQNEEKAKIPIILINIDGRYDEIKQNLSAAFCAQNNIHILDYDGLKKDLSLLSVTEQEREKVRIARVMAKRAASIVNSYRQKWMEQQPRQTIGVGTNFSPEPALIRKMPA